MDLSSAIELLRSELGDLAIVYLFGSRARGVGRSDSDVDLAVLTDSPLSPVGRFDLQEAIAARLGRDVDLVDLRAASTVLRVQVIDGGQVLYERDPNERALFEATTLGMYVRLNDERGEILADVRRRGHVHG